VVITDSTTVNLYKLAWAALGARPGRPVIVTDDDNFPTDRYVLEGVAACRGTPLRMIHTHIDEGISLAAGCSYKYLNAGPGAPAFQYVRQDLHDQLRQPIQGWFGQREQFAMGPGYDPVPGIGRFTTGTPNIIGTIAVEEGVRLLGEAGIHPLRTKGIRLTSYLVALADAWLAPLGCVLASPRDPARRGAHICLRHPEAWRISQALTDAGVVGDYRAPDRLRLGPAPITTRFTDVWAAMDTARRIIRDQAYRDLPDQPGPVT
jgi:kynureninase